MKKVASGILKVMDFIDSISAFVFMGIMIVAVFLQVIFRYVLKSPLVWSEELARYAMIYLVFIGVGYGTKTGAHLGVEMVINMVSGKVKTAIVTLAQVITLLLYVYLFFLAVQMTQSIMQNAQLSACMRMPMWLAYVAMPIGFGAGVIRQVEILYHSICEIGAAKKEGAEL